MENNNPTITPRIAQQIAMQQKLDNALSFKDLFYLCLNEWKWFVFSIIVCLAIASWYLLITPKSYTRTSSIMIKEERNGKTISRDMAQAFGDLGLSSSQTNVYNELKVIQSSDLARSVVKRLALNIDYKASGTFHDNTLYGDNLPVKVEFPGIDDKTFVSFDIDFINNTNQVKLSNFKMDGNSFSGNLTSNIGYKVIKSPVGRIVILQSPAFAKANKKQTIHVTRIGIDNARDGLLKRFDCKLSDKNTTVLQMTYRDVSPQRAEDVLNTYIAIYNENWVKDKNQIALSTSDFIKDRLQVIEKELGSVDNNISSYKTANQITDPKVASNLYLQKNDEADVQILGLNNQLFMAKNIRSYILNNSNFHQLLPANSGISSSFIESQIKDYNARLLQRNNLVANSSEQNPLVIDLDKQLETLRAAIIASIDNEIKTIQTQLNSQQAYAGETNQKISSSPNQQKYLLSVERQQKVKESLYLFLLQKREENELSQAFTAYNTRVIDVPQGSRRPTAPVSRNILLLALACGLCIPFGIIYLRESMNSTVRSKKDIEKKLTMPFLGEIPIYKRNIPKKKYEFWKKDIKPQTLVVREGSRGVLNEAFRVIGTNLEFMANDGTDKKNVFMTTSYNPGSGKSFIAANIGAIFAIKRKHVLIIDGDLRHASVSKCANSPKRGIADYLAGRETDIDDLIVTTNEFKNLDILPVGTIPPNPTELLSTPIFGELINKLRSRYDYIFIDCPPADMMADATIISKHADRTIFIIRAGLFERSMLTSVENDYKSGKFNNLALILNSVNDAKGHYGYGRYGYGKYGYAYGNGYGYGYGNKEKE